MIDAQPVERQLQDLDLVGVGIAADRETAIVRQGGAHEPRGITEMGGSVSSAEERLAKRWITNLALRDPKPDCQVEFEDRICVISFGAKLERLRVIAQRVGGSERGEGGVGCLV